MVCLTSFRRIGLDLRQEKRKALLDLKKAKADITQKLDKTMTDPKVLLPLLLLSMANIRPRP